MRGQDPGGWGSPLVIPTPVALSDETASPENFAAEIELRDRLLLISSILDSGMVITGARPGLWHPGEICILT